jgi:hypothetical protein
MLQSGLRVESAVGVQAGRAKTDGITDFTQSPWCGAVKASVDSWQQRTHVRPRRGGSTPGLARACQGCSGSEMHHSPARGNGQQWAGTTRDHARVTKQARRPASEILARVSPVRSRSVPVPRTDYSRGAAGYEPLTHNAAAAACGKQARREGGLEPEPEPEQQPFRRQAQHALV